MGIGLLGKKVGMTRFFTENGESIPVTVLKIEDNIISMIKSTDRDGYNAIQISTTQQKENKSNKPNSGHFKKSNIPPQKNIKEFKEYDLFRWEILRKPLGKDISSLKDEYDKSAFHLMGIKNKKY